jgi:hypothetical protein
VLKDVYKDVYLEASQNALRIPYYIAREGFELQPRDLNLFWGASIPFASFRDCEVHFAKEAAAEAGFDLVTITHVLPIQTPILLALG